MIAFADWFPLLSVAILFTTIGFLKLYGIKQNIIGGGGKSWGTRVRGSCPTWSRPLNVTVTVVFLLLPSHHYRCLVGFLSTQGH